ncbi:hypothetical protein, partial [Caldibacillus debilis]|uniref:hypothetical protein n=1 Tax=Caldibacillus debilis TaxID=301148 RepID=UPI0023F1F06F
PCPIRTMKALFGKSLVPACFAAASRPYYGPGAVFLCFSDSYFESRSLAGSGLAPERGSPRLAAGRLLTDTIPSVTGTLPRLFFMPGSRLAFPSWQKFLFLEAEKGDFKKIPCRQRRVFSRFERTAG